MAEIDPLNTDFAKRHPDAFAKILAKGNVDEIAALLGKLPPDAAASIVARLPASRVNMLLASGHAAETRWLSNAPLKDAVTLLSRIPRERSLALVNSVRNRERRRRLLQFLKYPSHSVGALVSDVPVRLTADTRAKEVLAELRAMDTTDPGPLIVVQPDGRYLGMLDLWALVVKDPPTGAISEYTIAAAALHPETTLESAVQNPAWHDFNWLPVIDHAKQVLGGVSRSSVFNAARKEIRGQRQWGDFLSVLIVDVIQTLGGLIEHIIGDRDGKRSRT